MTTLQRTIKKTASYSGIGLHTGNKTAITFRPAPANSGVKFVRTDLSGRPEIPALIEYVIGLDRGTSLGKGQVKIHTVEHVLSALGGLRIDNLFVELDANEPPVGDGSAKPFVDVLLKAGIAEQDAPKEFLEIDTPIWYSKKKEKGVELVALPADDFMITFMVDYKHPALGTQYTAMYSLDADFVKEFAPARTFCFLHEVEQLKEQGLIKGGTLENALVVGDHEVDEEELAYLKKLLGMKKRVFVGKNGFLNNARLRFPNEPCRHKALDLIGDLFLLGVNLKAHVLAARSGHAANVALVKEIRKVYEKKLLISKYQDQKAGEYQLDSSAIAKILPHRYPFLLIDRIIDLETGQRVVAIKNVTINEPFFQGHFPGHPIMPGVLIIEAMAQAGGVLLLNTVKDPEGKLVYFTAIDKVKLRRPVLPGDQIRFELEMVQFRLNRCRMAGKAYVSGQLVAEGEFMAAVVER
jgi:UDP-3-O-[3-hydroxymyristoyl] N-acetylglucosamine deacetylase/3-hydroxyacyl-[acyl-carrier-protein] dehydratase